MYEKSKNFRKWTWFWNLLILLFVVGFFLAIALPNCVGSNPGIHNVNGIVNNLRQLDAAKMEWAFQHESGVTNQYQAMQLTNQPTEQDLSPYLHFSNNQGGLIPPVAGESYTINPLNEPPEAKLVRKLDGYPKGTIIRLDDSPNSFPYKIILPN